MYSRSNKHRHAVSPSEITSLPRYLYMYLSFEADWIPFRGSLSFFDLLLFHSVNHLPMKLATLPSVCVCVCVCVREREREREIERECIFGHVFALVPPD